MKSLAELADIDRRGVSLYPRGTDFIRAAIALGMAKNELGAAVDFVAARWGRGSRAHEVTKAAVLAATTSEAGSGDLVAFAGAASEFFGVVNQVSILGRLAGMRRVPFDTRLLTALDGATAYWVGQGQAKPLTRTTFTKSTLSRLKVAAMTVATSELMESSDPSAEGVLRNDLLRATVNALDASFIDPANSGVADIEPASVTGSATAAEIAATASPYEDLRDLIAAFEGDLETAYFVMHPDLAAALNGTDRPNVGARGGSLMGVPVVTSRNATAGMIALIDPTGIALAEGEAEIKVSTQASILMDSEPAMHTAEMGSPSAPLAATLVSLWQTNAAAILVARFVNWEVSRPGSVAILSGATWGMGSP